MFQSGRVGDELVLANDLIDDEPADELSRFLGAPHRLLLPALTHAGLLLDGVTLLVAELHRGVHELVGVRKDGVLGRGTVRYSVA